MTFDIDALLSEYDAVSKQFAKASAQFALTKEWKDIVKSTQMKWEEQNGCTVVAKMERNAIASEAYKQAVEAYAAAEEIMLQHKMRLKSIELALDTWRTKESSARMERRFYPEIPIV